MNSTEPREKKIEEFLPLYIGCKCQIKEDGEDAFISQVRGVDLTRSNPVLAIEYGHPIWWDYKEVKPILRRLDSMTESERKEFEATKVFQLATPVHQIGLNVWTAKSFKWLLDKHFDIFDLIDSGAAIDAATLTKKD